MSKVHIFYHDDQDGWMSGFVAKSAIEEAYFAEVKELEDLTYSPIQYGYDLEKEVLSKVDEETEVYLLDFCLKDISHFEKLLNKVKKLVWIDHHKTSIELHRENAGFFGKYADKTDINLSLIGSACLLTWKYFYPEEEVPEAVQLISDYDTWAWKEKNSKFPLYLAFYLRKYEDIARKLNDCLFSDLFRFKSLLEVIEEGKEAFEEWLKEKQRKLLDMGFWTEIEGYRAYAINERMNSLPFEETKEVKNAQIYCTFFYTGKEWTISLYTSSLGIDVSKIAKKYGGGGHKQAAGFQISTEMLPKILKLR